MKKVNFKILTLIALLGAYSLVTSCNKNDDKSSAGSSNTDTTDGEIVGKWKHYKATYNGTTTFHESECFDSHGADYFEFKADNTIYNQIYSKQPDGSCVFNGDEDGTWEKSGNILTLILSPDDNGEGDGGVYEITVLNDTRLVIFSQGEADGTPYENIEEFTRW